MFRVITLSLLAATALAVEGPTDGAADVPGTKAPVSEAATVEDVGQAAEEAKPAVQGKTVYTLDPAATSLMVIVKNDPSGIASAMGHDHVIVSTNPSGVIEWDPSGVSPCSVSIRVPTSGLVADPPGMREKVGLDNRTISASQMNEMMGNMHGKRQLQSAVFPTIEYTATQCSGVDGQVAVEGAMTIRGVGKQFSLPMVVSVTADVFKAEGAITLRHSDFGFEPYSALFGALKNDEALEFRINVQAKTSL